MLIDLIGYIAVVIGAISTAPQMNQIRKTKKVRDINFTFFLLRSLASTLYIIYGILKYDYVMMASAIMPLFLELSVLILYIRYKNIEEKEENNEIINKVNLEIQN